MPYVGNIYPLVGPAEGDGDLKPWAIAGVGGGVFRSDGEHPPVRRAFRSLLLLVEARPPKMVATTLS